MQFPGNRDNLGADLRVRLAPAAFTRGLLLSITRGLELGDQGRFFELVNSTEHLPNEHRGRRVFHEEIRGYCRDQRDPK